MMFSFSSLRIVAFLLSQVDSSIIFLLRSVLFILFLELMHHVMMFDLILRMSLVSPFMTSSSSFQILSIMFRFVLFYILLVLKFASGDIISIIMISFLSSILFLYSLLGLPFLFVQFGFCQEFLYCQLGNCYIGVVFAIYPQSPIY